MHIEFIVYDGALGLDITGPLEVFHSAEKYMNRVYGKKNVYTFSFSNENTGPITLSSGLQINADTRFSDNDNSDILIIPGGTNIEKQVKNKGLLSYIQSKAKAGARIVSVCYGSFILAEAGLLNDKRATTHWNAIDRLQQNYKDINVDPDSIFVKSDNIYTSAGVSSGIDLALALVVEDLGLAVAFEVSRLLVLYYKRPGSQSQFSTPLEIQQRAGGKFADLHLWLVNNLTKDINVQDMAEFSYMSDRHFARVFKSRTGLTPAKYLETLRLDRAREILEEGNDSLDRIAKMCGFAREERLRRVFLRKFGVTPSQYKLHFVKN